MLPYYLILIGAGCMPFLFLWEQLFWLLALYLLSFVVFHMMGLHFLAYTLVLVYLGAIAILIVLAVLMMNLHRVWSWSHTGSWALFTLVGGFYLHLGWTTPLYSWFAPQWYYLSVAHDPLRTIGEMWYNWMPGLTCLLAWLLLVVTIGIVRSVTHKE